VRAHAPYINEHKLSFTNML